MTVHYALESGVFGTLLHLLDLFASLHMNLGL